MRLLADMAPLYDYAQMSRVTFGSVTPMSVMIQRAAPRQMVPDTWIHRPYVVLAPGPGDIELSADHGFVKNSIPGIFAVQVLGPGPTEITRKIRTVTTASLRRRFLVSAIAGHRRSSCHKMGCGKGSHRSEPPCC
ncbi:hypothetical protein [Arthrobacter sp. B2a2-09]|uniref:hypothetical protein n=1 Tax=Arthrobacter sp. B2a2-09 TaxID=2952822 RepID=UPI0022CD4E7A|nr:hypothetical protein [Arthrobacter sp. B2a2-09]